MQQITQQRYSSPLEGVFRPRLVTWFYNAEDQMIYRDNGDGELISESSMQAMKRIAERAPDISQLPMKATRDLLNFAKNIEL